MTDQWAVRPSHVSRRDHLCTGHQGSWTSTDMTGLMLGETTAGVTLKLQTVSNSLSTKHALKWPAACVLCLVLSLSSLITGILSCIPDTTTTTTIAGKGKGYGKGYAVRIDWTEWTCHCKLRRTQLTRCRTFSKTHLTVRLRMLGEISTGMYRTTEQSNTWMSYCTV